MTGERCKNSAADGNKDEKIPESKTSENNEASKLSLESCFDFKYT